MEHPDHFVVDASGAGEVVFLDDDANDWMHRILDHYECETVCERKAAIVEIFPNGIKITGSHDEATTKRLLREYLER
jgi:hypothetical protein